MVVINLKWNKLSFEFDCENMTTLMFKEKLFELTGVPCDRQKIMAKGCWTGTMKDDINFAQVKFKQGQQVMLMGSAEIVAEPKQAIQFVEDMTDTEKAQKGVVQSAGLNNLGNTCYMNSTIQCLRHIPELRLAMQGVHNGSDANHMLTTTLRNSFNQLDSSASAVSPMMFVAALRQHFPQFGEQSRQGGYMQQDAEEFYNALTQCLSSTVHGPSHSFDSILGIELEEKSTCQETEAEAPMTRTERVNKLVCIIKGEPNPTNHINEGVKLWLNGSVEKHSNVLGRDALWQKSARMTKLPKYLCVQMMRFFWKATPESRDHTGVKCKILREVKFADVFDCYEFCSEPLQASLRVNRLKEDLMIEDSVNVIAKRIKSEAPSAALAEAVVAGITGDKPELPMDLLMLADEEEREQMKAAMAMSLQQEEAAHSSSDSASATASASDSVFTFPSTSSSSSSSSSSSTSAMDTDSCTPSLTDSTGLYELFALVTHVGRSADSGHYIGWVRQAAGSRTWWCYNDDKVTEVSTDEILRMGGGADRDIAYLNFYRLKDPRAV